MGARMRVNAFRFFMTVDKRACVYATMYILKKNQCRANVVVRGLLARAQCP